MRRSGHLFLRKHIGHTHNGARKPEQLPRDMQRQKPTGDRSQAKMQTVESDSAISDSTVAVPDFPNQTSEPSSLPLVTLRQKFVELPGRAALSRLGLLGCSGRMALGEFHNPGCPDGRLSYKTVPSETNWLCGMF